MRLFLALRFDDRMTKTLTSVLHELKEHGVKGNFVPARNLHTTLVFIGETDEQTLVKKIIGNIPVPDMRITLDRLSLYHDVLVADLKGNQKLKEYVASVRAALDGAEIGFDHKKFSPHITLVRKAGGSFKGVILPKETAMISRVSLMKSERKDGRMVYTEIAGWGKSRQESK